MGEAHNTVTEAKRQMDETLAGVMPETWNGHGRLKLHDYGFSDEEDLARAKLSLEALAEKYPNTDTEKIAEKLIQKL